MPRSSFTCGVYKITLIRDGRCYIGSSSRVEQRFSEHRVSLNRGEHHSPYLQRVWDKYGERAFKFKIIEICSLDRLLEKEQFYIDENLRLFNSARVAGTRRGVPVSDKTKAKISKALKGKKMSPATIRRMVAAQRKRAAEMTDENRKILSDRMRKTMSRPEMKKLASAHAQRINGDPQVAANISAAKKVKPGWIPTEATRRKRSLALKGRVNGPPSEEVKRKLSKALKKNLKRHPRPRRPDGTFAGVALSNDFTSPQG